MAVALAAALALVACNRTDSNPQGESSARAAVHPDRLELGHAASDSEIAAVNIDVNADGEGLPPGSGTHAAGAVVYASMCASCHGAKGEGVAPNPRLIGRDPKEGFPFGNDVKLAKTVGNYWPYATTLYDYIHRSMPFAAPGSMKPNEIYGVIAFLLAENEIIPKDAVIDAKSLPKVKMPARDRFVADDRKDGANFR
jgi:cytochrome c